MQSLIHTHLPVAIILDHVRAADKRPIVGSETHSLAHTPTEESDRALDVGMHEQDGLFMAEPPCRALDSAQ